MLTTRRIRLSRASPPLHNKKEAGPLHLKQCRGERSLLCAMAGEGITPLTVSLIHPRGTMMSRRKTSPTICSDGAIIAQSARFVQRQISKVRAHSRLGKLANWLRGRSVVESWNLSRHSASRLEQKFDPFMTRSGTYLIYNRSGLQHSLLADKSRPTVQLTEREYVPG
jgi:hypothetical protein